MEGEKMDREEGTVGVAVAYRTATISRSVFATRFANWHFHCQISQMWRVSKAFGSENYRLALSGESVGNHVLSVIEISKIG